MAIKIKFDSANNPEKPTLILATRNGTKIGELKAENIVLIDRMNDTSEISFKVIKYSNNKKCKYWDDIVNFKLLWCREWDMWFSITVELDESDETIKTVYGTKLGVAELSQIMLYSIEINTENDIARDDYKEPTVLFNETNPEASLLHRIMEKAPHYSIIHVDYTIVNIQRTFTFDGISIYDAFQQIAEEIGCLFVFHSNSNSDGNIQRTISVYDLESNCLDCGYRGEFANTCPECGSKNITDGYGEDTAIFVTSDELADSIQFTTDTGSVKNCFKLEAGDDLLTATIRNCNPNGTDYIWYISDDIKEDMSDELVKKLEEYDKEYDYYQNDYISEINSSILSSYNTLVTKYQKYNGDLAKILSPIQGYPALMNAYYNTVDFAVYLQSELMLDASLSDTTAKKQVALLTTSNLSPVSVADVSNISLSTANSAVLAMAKVIVDSRYRVKINTSSLNNQTWKGNFTVINYSDEEDTATSSTISITIDDNYESYVKQKIEKTLNNDYDDLSISGLFDLDYDDFCDELQKYCLSRLNSFHDACQSCIDILIEQGIADDETWADSDPNLYEELYVPYYNKLLAIEEEIKLREEEISIIIGTYDSDGYVNIYGLQNYIIDIRDYVQEELDFENFLGETLWLEFCAYRREDKYINENYISDGLNNAELFDKALEFIEVANKEIYKSAELQHSISTSLKNLLVIKKFKPLVDYFKVGNWIRVQIDDVVYKLRLIEYEIDYDNLPSISVDFSDVLKTADGVSDQKSILEQATSMATSYESVKKQAEQGSSSKSQLDNWVNKGLALTNMKIVGNADNQNITWDSHGILCREYLPITDTYDDKQLKIINKGLYLTDDNWKTSRAGIGNFAYYDPKSGEMKESYGVIADTLVGNLILSEEVGIYNKNNSITLDENGIIITSDNTDNNSSQNTFTIQKKSLNEDGNEYLTQIMYIDSDGNLVLNGTIKINSSVDSILTINDLADTSQLEEKIMNTVNDELNRLPDESIEGDTGGVYSTINAKYEESTNYAYSILYDYKTEVGQYLNYDPSTGLTLGATSSEFSTLIDNKGMYFQEGTNKVAYITNRQLYIQDAIIRNSLIVGNFLFSPRRKEDGGDGGFSITWQED